MKKNLLNKSLSFCPNNQVDTFDLFLDLYKFVRKLSLCRFFAIQDPKKSDCNVIL